MLHEKFARSAPAEVAFLVETVTNMEHDALGGATYFGMLSGGMDSSARLSVGDENEELRGVLARQLALAIEARAAGEGERRVKVVKVLLLGGKGAVILRFLLVVGLVS